MSDIKFRFCRRGQLIGYRAEVVSVGDYYSYGGRMVERSYEVGWVYRWGFNGQEVVGELGRSHYTARYWEYDGRLGRRWEVDPKPTFHLSVYVALGCNPVRFSDPHGDTIRATPEAYQIMEEAFKATLGAEHPFYYDQGTGLVLYNKEYDFERYSPEQRDLINRYVQLIDAEGHVVEVKAVRYEERVIGRNKQSLADLSAHGVTLLRERTYIVERPNMESVTSISNLASIIKVTASKQEVYIATEPRNTIRPKEMRGLASIHEIAGHAYLNVFCPFLSRREHNMRVEEFERKIRSFYLDEKGKPIGGIPIKHEDE